MRPSLAVCERGAYDRYRHKSYDEYFLKSHATLARVVRLQLIRNPGLNVEITLKHSQAEIAKAARSRIKMRPR